jgi:hypothetical protein
LFSAVLSILSLGEQLAWYHVVGVAVIFAGLNDFGKIRPGAVAAGAGVIGVAV